MKGKIGQVYSTFEDLGWKVEVTVVGPRGSVYEYGVRDQDGVLLYSSPVGHACDAFCQGAEHMLVRCTENDHLGDNPTGFTRV